MKKEKTGRIILVVLSALFILAAILAFRGWHGEQVKKEKLLYLEKYQGKYAENTLILRGTSASEAKKLSEWFHADLRTSFDGKFSTLTLPEGTTVADIFADDANKNILSKLSLDFYASVMDTQTDDAPVLTHRNTYSVYDPDFAKQTYFDYLNFGDAWDTSKGEGITVAVIDTGIDTDHPEFSGKISEYSYNATLDRIVKDSAEDSASYDWSLIEDDLGHGTQVAGVIASAMNYDGTVGVAPQANLLVIKCQAESDGKFQTSDLVFAIYYAIERGVDVVNMSFGQPSECGENVATPDEYNPFADVLKLAADSDVICIAAAGNESTAKLFWPAADEHVISVGALAADSWDLASYSNYGDNTDVVAPGSVYTTTLDGGYTTVSGTSVACPQVAGAAALYLARHNSTELTEFREQLYASCRDLGDLGNDYYYGFGALDVEALICANRGTVTFDMLTSDVETIKQVFIEGHTLQDLPVPERNYAVFDGWYYDTNFTEELNWYEDIWTADLTLYAHWVNEDDGVPYTYVTLNDGTVEIRSYTGKRRFITVPEEIDGKIVSSIGNQAFMNQTRLRQITLPEGLEKIGLSAFENCSGLLSLALPDNLKQIGEKAFCNTARLQNIMLSDNSLLESIGKAAFKNSAITSFKIPANVREVDGSAFVGCTSLRAFEVVAQNPLFFAGDGVLYNGTKTVLLAYPAGAARQDTFHIPERVITVGDYAFSHAKVENVTLSGVQRIGESAFSYSSLTEISLPDSVKQLGNDIFFGCERLSAVALGGGIGSVADGMFANCPNLCQVEIPAQIYAIGEKSFAGSGLEEITFAPDSRLAQICNAAFSGTRIREIAIPQEVSLIGKSAFSGVSTLAKVTFPENSNLRTIAEGAFSGVSSLSDIRLPSGLETIKSDAFASSGLTNIAIPANVSVVGDGAFAFCRNLTEISVDEQNAAYASSNGVLYNKTGDTLCAYPVGHERTQFAVPEAVTTVSGKAFCGSRNITELTLSEGLLNIGEQAFSNMERLSKITLPDSVQQLSREAFAHSGSLYQITIGSNSAIKRIGFGAFAYTAVRSLRIPAGVSSMAQGVFAGCGELTNVTFSENSLLDRISAYMFYGADQLNQITFENGSALAILQAHALDGLTALQSVDFGDAAVENIGNYSFRFCENLKDISLPDSVTRIGRYAFSGCKSLQKVIVPEKTGFIGRHAFDAVDTIDVYFKASVLPENLQENWDFGVRGYYVGVTNVTENETWKYATLTSGGVSVIAYKGTDSSVDLSEQAFGEKVVSIGGHAFEGKPIKDIRLPDTLVSIQAHAFASTALEEIEIPETVTFIGKNAFAGSELASVGFGETPTVSVIEQNAFANCKKLKTVKLPASLKTMGQGVFSGSGLVSVDLREYQLTEIPDNTFLGSTLVSVDLPDAVTLVGHSAFRDCTELSFVTFGEGNHLRLMSNAFYNTALESVRIPENLTYIGEYALVGLQRLTAFEVSENNPNYQAIDGILYSKDGKKLIAAPAGKSGSISLPRELEVLGYGAFENSRLTKISFASGSNILTFGYRCFYNSSLTEISVPESVISLDYYAFAMCKDLTTVRISKGSQLKGIYEGVFYSCSSLRNIELPDSVAEISDFAFYGCSSLEKTPFGANSGVIGIYDYAFAKCGFEQIDLPKDVVEIGDYAFMGSKMKKLTISDTYADTLTLGLGVLSECSELEVLSVPFIGASFDDPVNTWFGYLFGAGEYEANKTYIPESLKHVHITGDLVNVRTGAFYQCTMLENIDLPDTVEVVFEHAFEECPARYSFAKPISLKSGNAPWIYTTTVLSPTFFGNYGGTACGLSGDLVFADEITAIHKYAFAFKVPYLKSLHLPKSIQSLDVNDSLQSEKIDIYYDGTPEEWVKNITLRTFNSGEAYNQYGYFRDYNLYCNGELLTDLYLPAGPYKNSFWGCSSIETVHFPEGMTEIPAKLISMCPNLKNADIPDSVTSIAENAFLGVTLDTFTAPKNMTDVTNVEAEKMVLHKNVQTISASNLLKELYLEDVTTLFKIPSAEYEFGSIQKIYLNGNLMTDLVVPNTISQIPYNLINGYALLESVTFTAPEIVIESYTFNNCPNLKKLIFADGVESISGYFSPSPDLEYVRFPASLKTLDSRFLSDLHSIDYFENNSSQPYQNQVYIRKEADGQFYYENVLHSGDIIVTPDKFRFDKITSADGAVTYSLLDYVGFESEITLPVTINECPYGYSYYIGRLAKKVIVPEGITDICNLFVAENGRSYGQKVEEVILPDSVTVIPANAFYNTNLTKITLGSQITEIGNRAFRGSNIKSITLPKTVTKIGMEAFYDCRSLESVKIPATVTSIAINAFGNCPSLHELTISPENAAYVFENGALYNKDKTQLLWVSFDVTDLVIPETVSEMGDVFAEHSALQTVRFADNSPVTILTESMFQGCTSLTMVRLPDGLTQIGAKAFKDCTALSGVTDLAGLKSVGDEAFRNCTSLKDFYFPETLNNIGTGAFWGSSLTQIDLTACHSLSYIRDQAFADCTSLAKVFLPDDMFSLRSEAFSGCKSLSEIRLPKNLQSIGWSAFESTRSLRSIQLPENLTYLDGGVFWGSGLESISIPKGVSEIKSQTFCSCFNLKEITIPDAVTKIGGSAFAQCWSLTSICLPEGVTNVDDRAFEDCTAIKVMYLPSTLQTFPKTYSASWRGPQLTDLYYNGTMRQWTQIQNSSQSSYTSPMPVENMHTQSDELVLEEGITTITSSSGFAGIHDIKTLRFPSTLVSVGADAFKDCTGLETIELSENLESIDLTAFDGCYNVKNIVLPDTNKNFVLKDGVLYNKDLTEIILVSTQAYDVCIPNTVTSFRNLSGSTGIRMLRFEENSAITELTDELWDLSNLIELSLPDGLTTFDEDMLRGCKRLSHLTIGKNVTTMTGNHNPNASPNYLRLFVVDNYSKVNLTLGDRVNNGGIARTALALTNADGVTVYAEGYENFAYDREGDYLFANYGNNKHALLTYLGTEDTATLPESYHGDPYTLLYMTGLKNVIVPNASVMIPNGAFEESDIETIEIYGASVGSYAFIHCNSFRSAKLYDVSHVSDYAFAISTLESLYFRGKNAVLGSKAFGYNKLTDLEITGTIREIGDGLVESTPYEKDESNYSSGLLIRNGWLISVLPSLKYAPQLKENIATGAYNSVRQTLKGVKDESAFGFTNLEFLILSDNDKGSAFFAPQTLKNVLVRKSYEINEYTFSDISNGTIFVEKEKRETDWDDRYPGWNHGNKVYYGGTWCFVEFRDYDDTILDWHAYSNSEVIRQPYMQDRTEGEYIYIFAGWDLDGDGHADFVPASSQTDIYAKAVYEKHRPADSEIIPATCTTDGSKTTVCIDCGQTIFKTVLPAFGHVKGAFVKTVEPTCAENGYTAYLCETCQAEFHTDEIPKTEHTYGKRTVVKEASCTQNGLIKQTCLVCGYTDTVTIPAAGHSYSILSEKKATCTAYGETLYGCSVCGNRVTERTAMLPHDYQKRVVPKHWLRVLIEKLLNMFFGYEGNNIYYYECRVCRHIQTADEHTSDREASVQGVGCMHEIESEWKLMPTSSTSRVQIFGKSCNKCGELIEAKLADATVVSIKSLTAVKEADLVKVDMTVENVPEEYFACLSVYDEHNRMIKAVPVTFTENAANIRVDWNEVQNAAGVRLFIWNKISLAPLCESVPCQIADSVPEVSQEPAGESENVQEQDNVA